MIIPDTVTDNLESVALYNSFQKVCMSNLRHIEFDIFTYIFTLLELSYRFQTFRDYSQVRFSILALERGAMALRTSPIILTFLVHIYFGWKAMSYLFKYFYYNLYLQHLCNVKQCWYCYSIPFSSFFTTYVMLPINCSKNLSSTTIISKLLYLIQSFEIVALLKLLQGGKKYVPNMLL